MLPADEGFLDRWSVASGHPPQRRRRCARSDEPTNSPADVAAVRTAVHERMQVVVAAPGRNVDNSDTVASGGRRDRAIVVVGLVAPHEAGAAFCHPVDVLESGNELGHARRVEWRSHLGHVDLCEFRPDGWITASASRPWTNDHRSAQLGVVARATGFPSGSRTYPTRSPQGMSPASRMTSVPADRRPLRRSIVLRESRAC